MSDSKKASSKVIRYEPTSPDVLEHFARSVCQELGGDFANYDTIQGLASFMKVIARATANDLNRKAGGEVDNSI
jgi:hypothetical protein